MAVASPPPSRHCPSLLASRLRPPTPTPNPFSFTIRTNKFFSSISKTKPLSHTLKLLPLLPTIDTVTYNTALSACLLHHDPSAALQLFIQMLRSSSPPDLITLRLVLRGCAQSGAVHLLPQLHSYVLKLQGSFASSEVTTLNTCLLKVYCEFGFVEMAHEVFVAMPERDVVALTSMMNGFVEAGECDEGLRVFENMVECDCLVVNEHVYSSALHACAGICCLFEGRQIHARIVKSGKVTDVFVGTGLVDLYVKCGEVECAKRAFLEILEPNVMSWNALMAGNLGGEEGMQLFSEMRLSGASPDFVTFASVLRACKDVLSTYAVRQLHGLIMKTTVVELDVYLSCALFEAYIDGRCFVEAQKVFGRMREKDDATFNLAIRGYLRNGCTAEAAGLFLMALKMGKEVREVTLRELLMTVGGLEQGKQLHALVTKFGCCDSNAIASIAAPLIRMYAEHHCLDDAMRLFERIPFPDLVLWTSLISSFSQIGASQRALDLYVKMITEEGTVGPPNHFTFSTLLSSCIDLVAVEEGKQIHAQVIKSTSQDVKSDPFVQSGLLYMYAKCGYIEEARRIFSVMPERDLASWNAMISSLAQHGFAKEAVKIFEELLSQKDLEPNHITFVGVLTACSHCGMVEMGNQYFKSIKEPTIDHYACLINLFGRAGQLKEALDIVEEMPYEANEIVWSSLLAASSMYGNIKLGEYSARKLLELNPKDPGTYIALSNIYAAAGRWKDVKRTRKQMKSQANNKCPGFSWVGLNGNEHVFFSDGRTATPNRTTLPGRTHTDLEGNKDSIFWCS